LCPEHSHVQYTPYGQSAVLTRHANDGTFDSARFNCTVYTMYAQGRCP
jgi:hypothetical protein